MDKDQSKFRLALTDEELDTVTGGVSYDYMMAFLNHYQGRSIYDDIRTALNNAAANHTMDPNNPDSVMSFLNGLRTTYAGDSAHTTVLNSAISCYQA